MGGALLPKNMLWNVFKIASLFCLVVSQNFEADSPKRKTYIIATKVFWAENVNNQLRFCSKMTFYKDGEPMNQSGRPQCQKGVMNAGKRNRLWKRKWSHKKFFEFAL